jgi:hypothetical protein
MDTNFITDHQPAIVSNPGKCTLHFPSFFVSTQLSSILRFLFYPIHFMRGDQVYSSLFQSFTQWIRVRGFIINQTLDFLTRTSSASARYRDRIQRIFNQSYLYRRCRVQVVPQRNSLAICHHHPLRTLSTLGFSDAEPPFLADAKLPSAKVSAQLSWPFRSSSERNARQAVNQASFSSHSCNRRQHVDGEGYWAGRSFHRAPLRSTQRIPSKQRRLEIRLRPFLSAVSSSRKGAILFHCLSVSSLANLFVARESSFEIVDSPVLLTIN